MKNLLLFLGLVVLGQAASTSNSTVTTQNVAIAGSDFDISFAVSWWSDDYPLNSAPGRIDLFDGNGTLVGTVSASHYRSSGPSVVVSGGSSVDGVSSTVGRFCPNGTPADGYLSGTWHITGLTPGNYQIRLWAWETYDTAYSATGVFTDTYVLGTSDPAPANTAPSIAWVLAPATAGSGQSYVVNAAAHDAEGNLTQVNVWKNGAPFAFGGGGNGSDAESGNATADGGPQSVTFTAQAVDGAGATSPMITHTVTIDAPAPATFSLTVNGGPGGTVSGGGTFPAGSYATINAVPDFTHEFAGWSGDAGGMATLTTVAMDADRTVQASFVLKSYALATSAAGGGSVSPGGSFPYGTTISISATPDTWHYFTGWSGDASGTMATIGVLIDRAKFVQAQFAAKAAQSISFPGPGNQPVGTSVNLVATASSGLPVVFQVLSGAASVSGNTLTISGPGPVSVQAVQPGDATTLPASPVAVSFNAAAPVVIRYRPAARTLLQSRAGDAGASYVIGNP